MHPDQEVPMLPAIPDPDRRVHVHLHVPESVRRALRLVAAHRGVTIAAVVAHWAVAEAGSLGLVDPKEPKGEVRPETRMPESIRPAPKNPISSPMDRAKWVDTLSDGRGIAMAERTEEEVLAAIVAERTGGVRP